MEKLNRHISPKIRFKNFHNSWSESSIDKCAEINPSNQQLPDEFYYIDLDKVNHGRLKSLVLISKKKAPSRAQRYLRNHDILYQTVRPYQKNNYFFENDTSGQFVASTGYAQLRAKVYPKFLYHLIHTQTFVNKVLLKCTGTSYPAINSSDLGSISVYIPQLEEQQNIANFLTAVDKKIELLEQKKKAFEKYKKGVMQAIFSQKIRFKKPDGSDYSDWEKKKLGDLIDYEQPTKYIVKSTEYDNRHKIPVLTAGKTFILGYTDETDRTYNDLPVIIFDDFTTASQYVNFPFKVKSSAMKILKPKEESNIRFIFEAIQQIKFEVGGHCRHWISKYSNIKILVPSPLEQAKIAEFLTSLDNKVELTNTELEQAVLFKKSLLQQMFV